MCINKSELNRAKRVLQSTNEEFQLLRSRSARQSDDGKLLGDKIAELVGAGLAESRDVQQVWRIQNQVECLLLRFRDAAELEGVCAAYLTRLASGRLLPSLLAKKQTFELEALRQEAGKWRDGQASPVQLDALRSRLEASLRAMFHETQTNYGRLAYKQELLMRVAVLSLLALPALAIMANVHFQTTLVQAEPGTKWVHRLLGFGTWLALLGIAGGSVAQGASVIKQTPRIRTLNGRLERHLLTIVLGGLLAVALAYFIEGTLLFAPLREMSGKTRDCAFLSMAFVAGLVPSTISQLMSGVAERAGHSDETAE